MNVASLELCKELYELSGWRETFFVYQSVSIENVLTRDSAKGMGLGYENPPAYDLGYLLRKLRDVTLTNDVRYGEEAWHCGHYDFYGGGWNYDTRAESPEDAAAKLAIELFKLGILTKENS